MTTARDKGPKYHERRTLMLIPWDGSYRCHVPHFASDPLSACLMPLFFLLAVTVAKNVNGFRCSRTFHFIAPRAKFGNGGTCFIEPALLSCCKSPRNCGMNIRVKYSSHHSLRNRSYFSSESKDSNIISKRYTLQSRFHASTQVGG